MHIFTKIKKAKAHVYVTALLSATEPHAWRARVLSRPSCTPLPGAKPATKADSADVTFLRQRRPGPASEYPKGAPETVTRGGREGGDPAL